MLRTAETTNTKHPHINNTDVTSCFKEDAFLTGSANITRFNTHTRPQEVFVCVFDVCSISCS